VIHAWLPGRVGWSGKVVASTIVAVGATLLLSDQRGQRGLFAFQEPPSQAPSFRSASSELVVLPVIVTDKPDQYVAELKQEQFTVYDNGRKVAIDFFSAEDTPVTVGLVLDASSSVRKKVGDIVAASAAFARSSNPDDELFAVYFNDEVQDALPGRGMLLASDAAGLHRALQSLVPEGRTSLYDGLIHALERLATGTRTRKALVLISDGGDNASTATLDQVLAKARASNAAIYTIGVYDDYDPDKNPGVLKSLAKETGGERFLPRSAGPLMVACQHIAREIRSGYTIGYTPPDRDGAFHRVRVEVTPDGRRKLTARTRPGYFASRQSGEPR
jgi:Ca-activated chloride channel homolog